MLLPEPNQASISFSFDKLQSEESLQLRVTKALEVAKKSSLPIYVSVTLKTHTMDTLALLEHVQNKNTFRYYWEKPNDSFSMIAGGEHERIKSKGASRFRDVSNSGKELLDRVFHFSEVDHSKSSIHLLGGFSFFDHSDNELWKSYGPASFTLPKWHVVKDGQLSLITSTVKVLPTNSVEDIFSSLSQQFESLDLVLEGDEFDGEINDPQPFEEIASEENEKSNWLNKIETAVDLIKEGSFKKIVLARKLHIRSKQDISDTSLLNQLRQQYPDCYSFLIGFDDKSSFIGATPERLAGFKRTHILTEGLAGSISRGRTASEDAYLEHSLLNSKKDLNEHAFVVDAIEATLSPFAKNIEHPSIPGIKKLSNVQHLFTPMTAYISETASRTEVLKNLHPTPAVGGFPKEKAVPFINKLENFDRGWYAGPIGWINASGEGEFAVAIRSGLIKKREAHFFAGCGIVENSNPLKEWEETKLKFIPMLSALKNATQ